MQNHRNSKIKRLRKSGFRSRMKSSKGKNIINRQRRAGRTVNAV